MQKNDESQYESPKEQSIGDSLNRTHPCLPAADELKMNPSLFYSDHIPLLFEIPVSQQEKIKAITYNVCAGSPSAYDEVYDFNNENYEKNRHERIAQGLKNSASKQAVDVILLQEVTAAQLDVLRLMMGEDWEILCNPDLVMNSTVTCYKKDKFLHEEFDSPNKFNFDAVKGIQTVTLKSKLDVEQPPFKIVNFWGEYKVKGEDTSGLVDEINSHLNDEQNIILVAGDFNNPIHRVVGQQNVTNLGPERFTKMTDAAFSIDGALYKKPGHMSQNIEMHAIDLHAGIIIRNEDLKTAETMGSQYDNDRPLLSEAVIISADDALNDCLIAIQKQIDRLNDPHWYLRKDKIPTGKIAALTNLKDTIMAQIQGVDKKEVRIKIKNIIESWEQLPALKCGEPTKTYGDILGAHRFVFFSEKNWFTTATTQTRDALNSLKRSLDPRAEILDKLERYLSKHQKNGTTDFQHGLWIKGQAQNREANYKLAKELKNQLEDNPNLSVKEIFTDLLSQRKNLMDESFASIDRGINSRDLLKIINMANPDWKLEKKDSPACR